MSKRVDGETVDACCSTSTEPPAVHGRGGHRATWVGTTEQPALRGYGVLLDVPTQNRQQLVRDEDGARGVVLGGSELGCRAADLLHLAFDPESSPEEVDVVDAEGRR